MNEPSTTSTGTDPELHQQFGAVRVVRRRQSPLRRRSRRAVRAFGSTMFVVTSLACVCFTAAILMGHWSMPLVLTGSMAPAIERGDVVVSAPVDTDEVREGDVIVFVAPGDERVTVHRVDAIVRREDGSVFTTRGDANAAPDPWELHMDQPWVHRVRFTVPHLGGLIRASKFDRLVARAPGAR